MRKPVLSKADIRFIRKNRLQLSSGQLAKKIGCSKTCIQRYLRKNGLRPPSHIIEQFRIAAMRGRTTSTTSEDLFLKNNYLKLPEKRMAAMLNRSHTFVHNRLRQLDLVKPKELVEKFIADSRIKPGNVPFSKGKKQTEFLSKEGIKRSKKTRFKKGNIPANAKEKDGTITVRIDHRNRKGIPYKHIRISLGKWQPLHRYRWEKKYGPIPNGKILTFKDGNTLNCRLKNLKLITRRQNMIRNTIHKLPEELKTTIRTIGVLNRKIHKYEKQNR